MPTVIFGIAAAVLFGPLKDVTKGEKWNASYGCWYHLTDKSKKDVPYFVSGTDDPKTDERYALVHIDGKDNVFTLVKSVDRKDKKAKVGDKDVREYMAGDVRLKAEFIVKSVCKPQTGCESDDRELRLTVRRGKEKQSLALTGYCAI
jgi:hypothetical protein